MLWAAAGFGGACAGCAAVAPPGSGWALCEQAQALPGAMFTWGKRFTGNDVVGYSDKVPVDTVIGGKQVAYMAFGTSVGAACDGGGDVWWWGTTAAGGGPSHADKAQVILSGKRIVKVVCGANDSYALSRNGSVWTWPNEDPRKAKQLRVPGGGVFASPSVVDIASCATSEHFVCVTADGRALAMGNGSRGQLGSGDCEVICVLVSCRAVCHRACHHNGIKVRRVRMKI